MAAWPLINALHERPVRVGMHAVGVGAMHQQHSARLR